MIESVLIFPLLSLILLKIYNLYNFMSATFKLVLYIGTIISEPFGPLILALTEGWLASLTSGLRYARP